MLGIGQISLDRVWFAPGPPPEAGAPEPPGAREFPGGQVATAVLACARLGLRAAFCGAVGDDRAAERVLAPLRAAGVDLAGVRRVGGGATRCARIHVDPESAERRVRPLRDPRVVLRPRDLDLDRVASARALHLDAEYPATSLRAAQAARRAGVPVVLDTDRLDPEVEALLEQVDFAIVPRSVAETLSVDRSLDTGLRALAERARRLAVVTLGPGGARTLAPGAPEPREFPAFRVEARDTTGAGDAFRAGFVWALLEGEGLEGVLRAARAAAALNCTAPGAQGGLPDRPALEAFLRERAPERD